MTTRDEIIAKVKEVDARARMMFPAYANAPALKVAFFSKGRTAGWAKYGIWTVEFNEHQMAETTAIRDLTVPHEIAHMVCYYTGLGKGHNAGWKRVCRILGGDGKRCYDAAERGVTFKLGRRTREYKYDNGVTSVWLGASRHKKLQLGKVSAYVSKNSRIQREHYTGETRVNA
jgi:predicted SprT family Zn-dependent metalloprotease